MNKKHEIILKVLLNQATALTVADIATFFDDQERVLIGDNRSLAKIMYDLKDKGFVETVEKNYEAGRAVYDYAITNTGKFALNEHVEKNPVVDDSTQHKQDNGDDFYSHLAKLNDLYTAAVIKPTPIQPDNIQDKLIALRKVYGSPFEQSLRDVLYDIIKDYEAIECGK